MKFHHSVKCQPYYRFSSCFQAQDVIVVDDDEDCADEDVKSKNLVSFLGMKDGLTASIASQGSLSESAGSQESPRGSLMLSR